MTIPASGRRRAGRVTLAAAVVAALALGIAGPAHADPEGPAPDTASIQLFSQDLTVAPAGAPGKPLSTQVITSGAVNPRVVVDVRGVAGIATVSFPAGCTTDGTVTTCPAPPGSVDNNAPLDIVVTAVDGVTAGTRGTIRLRGDADNPGDGNDLMSAEAVVTVAGNGPDLALIDPRGIPDAEVGDRISAPLTLTNYGNRATKGVRVVLEYTYPLTPTPYSNCVYGYRKNFRERGAVAVCDFTRRIEPGGVYTLKTGFGALVTPAAVDHEVVEISIAPLTGAGLPEDIAFRSWGGRALPLLVKTAPPATAKAVSAADIDPTNDYSYLGFTVDNLLDVAAVGASAPGTVGDVVAVEVGARNIGGAIDFTRSGSSAARFAFRLPSGTEAVGVPANCSANKADPATYTCRLPSLYFAPAATFLRTFTLRITGASFDPGVVTILPTDDPAIDEDWTNDTATVTVTSAD
jgi:hypothetical protein